VYCQRLSLTKKVALIFILSFTALAVIDSTIVKFYATSGRELSPSSNTVIFILFSIIFENPERKCGKPVVKITIKNKYCIIVDPYSLQQVFTGLFAQYISGKRMIDVSFPKLVSYP
jgi:hypothetical protein